MLETLIHLGNPEQIRELATTDVVVDRFRRHLLRVLLDELQNEKGHFPRYAKTERESVCQFAREPRKVVKRVVAHG